jgi:hypothetical protein
MEKKHDRDSIQHSKRQHVNNALQGRSDDQLHFHRRWTFDHSHPRRAFRGILLYRVRLLSGLLPLYLSAQERQRMLVLLVENLREHREIARLDSSDRHYQEISADVLLLHGGKTGIGWVRLAIEQLATVLPQSHTHIFPRLNHFGIDKQAPEEVARIISNYFSGTR